MKRKYTVGVDMGFSEDKTIIAMIFKSDDVVNEETGEVTKGVITKVEVFESNFASKAEITKFKKILSDDLGINLKDLVFNLIPRGDLTPEKDRSEN